jgi:hypothetical protein
MFLSKAISTLTEGIGLCSAEVEAQFATPAVEVRVGM